MTRLSIGLAVAALAFLVGCAPLQELAQRAARATSAITLAPDSRLAQAARDPMQCQALLREEGVVFTPVRDQTEGEFCEVRNAMLLGAQPVRMSPARPMMACPLAATFLLWTRYSVEPAAREVLGSELRQVDHFGVYACRRVNGRAEGPVSGHARAEAIDVAGFRLANGRQVRVEADWAKPGAEGQFLHRVRDEACRAFGMVLSPDYNALHANHLHLEVGAQGPCG